jgi:DNA polymerase sigma
VYRCVFDPRRMGVSIRAGGMYIDRNKGHSIDPLYIEDPLNPLNNVGRNCFRILQCTKAFGEGHVLLSKQLHLLDTNSTQANLFSKILTKCRR